jgi:hypothetical protein
VAKAVGDGAGTRDVGVGARAGAAEGRDVAGASGVSELRDALFPRVGTQCRLLVGGVPVPGRIIEVGDQTVVLQSDTTVVVRLDAVGAAFLYG